jgi:hypothetical protein
MIPTLERHRSIPDSADIQKTIDLAPQYGLTILPLNQATSELRMP